MLGKVFLVPLQITWNFILLHIWSCYLVPHSASPYCSYFLSVHSSVISSSVVSSKNSMLTLIADSIFKSTGCFRTQPGISAGQNLLWLPLLLPGRHALSSFFFIKLSFVILQCSCLKLLRVYCRSKQPVVCLAATRMRVCTNGTTKYDPGTTRLEPGVPQ